MHCRSPTCKEYRQLTENNISPNLSQHLTAYKLPLADFYIGSRMSFSLGSTNLPVSAARFVTKRRCAHVQDFLWRQSKICTPKK
jgi:hypothetical protein